MLFQVGKEYVTEGGETVVYIGVNPYAIGNSKFRHVFSRPPTGRVFTTDDDGKVGRTDGEPAWCDIEGESQ